MGFYSTKSQTLLVQYPAGRSGGDYTIPNTVFSIGNWAFYGSTSLTGITIGNSVSNIGVEGFSAHDELSVCQDFAAREMRCREKPARPGDPVFHREAHQF